jgi:hypothetical protein
MSSPEAPTRLRAPNSADGPPRCVPQSDAGSTTRLWRPSATPAAPSWGISGCERGDTSALREPADDLPALVLRLRDDHPTDVRGAAMTSLLLNDGASPLHRNSGKDLRRAL